jgi:hypothetical protein
VIEGTDDIKQAIERRADLDSLYLCGPFGEEGNPASSDIHILALGRGEDIKDLHFPDGLSGRDRRIEVSVVPARNVRASWQNGVKTWLEFYTLDKIRRGQPILETPAMREIRQSLKCGVKLKPSFYTRTMSRLRGARDEGLWSPGPAAAALRCNIMLLLSLNLYSLLRLKTTFSRNSDLLTQAGSVRPLVPTDAKTATAALEDARIFLRRLLGRRGFNVGAAGSALGDSGGGETA